MNTHGRLWANWCLHQFQGFRLVVFLISWQRHATCLARLSLTMGLNLPVRRCFFWSKETKVKLSFIQPGKPTQNAFCESLNGKFRNECLNQHWFRSIEEARHEINHWRQHYNNVRPHSSLGYQSPVDFAKKAA